MPGPRIMPPGAPLEEGAGVTTIGAPVPMLTVWAGVGFAGAPGWMAMVLLPPMTRLEPEGPRTTGTPLMLVDWPGSSVDPGPRIMPPGLLPP